MSRSRLVRALEQLPSLTPPACFVLLWTYFEEVGLGTVEDRLRAEGLKSYQLRSRLESAFPAPLETCRRLAQLVHEPVDFDRLAVEWMARLDLALKDGSSARFDPFEFLGLNGVAYRVRRRNNLIAHHFEGHLEASSPTIESARDAPTQQSLEPTWVAHQGRSLFAYVRDHLIVPTRLAGGIELNCLSELSWNSREARAKLVHAKATGSLRILLWPFRCRVDYVGLDWSQPLPDVVSLREVSNEAELAADVREAIETARRVRATILVFPELSIPPAVEAAARQALTEGQRRQNPALSLLGLCHQPSGELPLDLNEAVLLGPDGRELHRHRKLVCFSDQRSDCGERLETGHAVTVLESSIGNLVPLICLDLLNVAIRDLVTRTHGNLLLVPSLSPTTQAHSNAASDLQVRQLASSFVTNRWFDHTWQAGQPPVAAPERQGSSFFRVPRRVEGYVTHLKDRPNEPYLLFSLETLDRGLDS